MNKLIFKTHQLNMFLEYAVSEKGLVSIAHKWIEPSSFDYKNILNFMQ